MTAPDAATAEPAVFRSDLLVLSALLLLAYIGVIALLPASPLEVPLGLFVLLLAPGYAAGALLFPGSPSFPWPVSVGLVVGLSVAINILLGLATLAGRLGLPASLFAGVAFVLTLAGLAVRREGRSPWRAAARPRPAAAPGPWAGFSGRQRGASYGVLAATAIVLAVIVGLSQEHPNVTPDLVLSLEGPGGSVASLPSHGPVGAVLSVWVTITDNGSAQRLVLEVQSVNLSATPGPFHVLPWTLPMRLGNATQSSDAFNLVGGQSYTVNFTFSFGTPGTYAIDFDLTEPTGGTLRMAAISVMIQ